MTLAPASLSRRPAFWLVTYTYLVVMFGTTMPTPLYVLYQNRWHFSTGMITVIFAAYPVGVLASLLLFGSMSDQVGRRPVLFGGLGFAASSTTLFIFAQGIPSLLVARALSGLAAGIFTGTATATMTELHSCTDTRSASQISTAANISGLGLGIVVSGVLAQYVPSPTKLVFVVYFALLVPTVLVGWLIPETVTRPEQGAAWQPMWPCVPTDMRGPFALAATAVFCSMATTGTFTALTPSFLRTEIHVSNLAVAGGIVCVLFAVSAIAQVTMRDLGYRLAMGGGLGVMAVTLALIVASLRERSLLLFICAAACTGLAFGLTFMGSLEVVNSRAPVARRAEVVSAYFVAAYAGAALPQLGLGIASWSVGLFTATAMFAVVIGLLALGTAGAMCWMGSVVPQIAGARLLRNAQPPNWAWVRRVLLRRQERRDRA